MIKKLITALLAALALTALPLTLTAQTSYSAQSGVSLLTGTPATAAATSGAVRLPTFSGTGTLNVTGVGITGSPSGCQVALKYQQNNAVSPTAAVSTTSFTPAVSVQTFAVAPTIPSGDNYIAAYTCSVYPTAGSLNISFSPIAGNVLVNAPGLGDPCQNPGVAKSTVSVAISTATTTQLVALAAGKSVYQCGFAASFGATTTAQFEYGTGSACGTGTTVLTGAYAPATGGILTLSAESAHFNTPAGNALCLVSTGTGGINGALTFVQQ